jgi:hypothetical protein
LLQTACHSLSKNVFPALMLFFLKKKNLSPIRNTNEGGCKCKLNNFTILFIFEIANFRLFCMFPDS